MFVSGVESMSSPLSAVISAQLRYDGRVMSVTRVVSVSTFDVPGVRFVIVHVTVNPETVPPSLAETNAMPAGMLSCTVIAPESTFPWLVTVIGG